MKIITAFAVFVIIFCPIAAAQEYSFSVEPQFGIYYAQAEEIVYPSASRYPLKSKGDLLSQLLWDIKPLYYYGIRCNYSLDLPKAADGFFSSLTIRTAIPGLSGVMEDRDWRSIQNNNLTDYSSHDNHTDFFLWADFSAGFSFAVRPKLFIKAQLAFSYMNFCFSGMNGKGTYARETSYQSGIFSPITVNPRIVTFTGQVISYSQEWFCLLPGVSVEYKFFNVFSGELLFQISPLNFCNDTDKHYKTAPVSLYKDYLFGGLFIEPRLTFTFSPVKQFGVSLETAYRYIVGTKGLAYYRSLGTGADFTGASDVFDRAGEAGAGLKLFDCAVMVKIRL